MSKEEAQIWTDFLKTFEIPFLRIEYDVHLGEGIPPKPGEPEWLVRLKRAITRKRVDAIAETEEDIWIFEVKPRIGMSALGQLLTYYELYMEEYSPEKPIMLAAVGRRKEPDIDGAFELYAVNIFLV